LDLMSNEAQPSPVDETVPVEFAVVTTYSPHGKSLQRGSRYSFAPVPTALEYEITHVGDIEWVVFVWHTPGGTQRFGVPKAVAEQAWENLGKALGHSDIAIATRLPILGEVEPRPTNPNGPRPQE
jgi:hypothetical protein